MPARADGLKGEAIRVYAAAHCVRHYGSLPARFPENLRANLRRRYKVGISRDEAVALAEHFRAIYAYGAKGLPRFLSSPKNRTVDWGDLAKEPFLRHLAAGYPDEPRAVLESIGWYVMLYEYLK